MLRDLILKTRSFRRFDETHAIKRETLVELVDLARLSASAANLQPLKYILSYDPAQNALIFPHLAWAGYLENWSGPAEGEVMGSSEGPLRFFASSTRSLALVKIAMLEFTS